MTDENAKGGEWLARNARHCGDEKWSEAKGTSQWDRATTAGRNADYGEEDGLGRYWVRYPDGDIHSVLLVKDSGEYVGSCDCEGFQHNTGVPCAHLCALRLKEWESKIEVDQSHDYARQLLATGSSDETDAEGDVSESKASNDPQPPAESEGFEKASEVPAEPEQTDDAFANPLPEVDDKYAISMNGETYIRKAGYARLLSQQGWTVETEEVVGSHETEWTRAKYQARIFDETGRQIATSVGTAGPAEKEDMADADMHLDELAETRAWTRAASIATGEGMTAMAEIPEHASEEVNGNV